MKHLAALTLLVIGVQLTLCQYRSEVDLEDVLDELEARQYDGASRYRPYRPPYFRPRPPYYRPRPWGRYRRDVDVKINDVIKDVVTKSGDLCAAFMVCNIGANYHPFGTFGERVFEYYSLEKPEMPLKETDDLNYAFILGDTYQRNQVCGTRLAKCDKPLEDLKQLVKRWYKDLDNKDDIVVPDTDFTVEPIVVSSSL